MRLVGGEQLLLLLLVRHLHFRLSFLLISLNISVTVLIGSDSRDFKLIEKLYEKREGSGSGAGSVPLTNGSGSPTRVLCYLRFFGGGLIIAGLGVSGSLGQLKNFMRKGKDPYPDPYL
jgi:hypothetical protein